VTGRKFPRHFFFNFLFSVRWPRGPAFTTVSVVYLVATRSFLYHQIVVLRIIFTEFFLTGTLKTGPDIEADLQNADSYSWRTRDCATWTAAAEVRNSIELQTQQHQQLIEVRRIAKMSVRHQLHLIRRSKIRQRDSSKCMTEKYAVGYVMIGEHQVYHFVTGIKQVTVL